MRPREEDEEEVDWAGGGCEEGDGGVWEEGIGGGRGIMETGRTRRERERQGQDGWMHAWEGGKGKEERRTFWFLFRLAFGFGFQSRCWRRRRMLR